MEMEAPNGSEPTAIQSRPRRRTPDEWKSLVEQWTGSGESIAGFCRREGVNVCQFFAWRKRLSPASPSDGREGGFIEAVVVGRSPAARSNRLAAIGQGSLEIVLLNGRRICVEGAFDEEQLRRLVRLLEAI